MPELSPAACVFDAYGTLFDVHSAARVCRHWLGEEADRVSDLWRRKQLEYSWLRSLMGRHADFWQVTREALEFALAAQGRMDPRAVEDLLDAYLHLDPYPEVHTALKRIRDAGIRVAILSNGSPAMLSALVASSGLQLDGVLSVEEAGVYKPDPRVYRLACRHLDLPPGEIAFFSSNAWDISGAASFGLRAVWVNRSGQPEERLPGQPERMVPDLSGLPAWSALG